MNESREVKIKIDDSFTQPACDHSVGFLRFRKGEKSEIAVPAGTGVFVKLGKVYGILTAGHVLTPMGQNEVVGLVRFPSIKPALQNFRLDLNHTDKRINNWNGVEGDAPDIGFLKIPEKVGRDLEAAGAVFYNLGIPRQFTVSKPEHKMSKCYAVVGIVGEWTDQGDASMGKGKKVEVGGLFGAAKNLKEIEEKGTKLVEVEIDHAEGPRIPKSYGGVSGGGLWELNVELDQAHKTVKVNKRLIGVAFRESKDGLRITCNATSEIDVIKNKITEAWKEEVEAT